MHAMLDTPGKVSIPLQARYDILLTDAILNLMNNLHYGKLNPEFPASRIDALTGTKFQADAALLAGMGQKDLLSVIAAAQPADKLYRAMQWRMHMLEGQLQGDCYEIPEAEVRKLAINMERLRWSNTGDSVYIQVNIPSYTLIYRAPDSLYRFKVVVGKPETPTPTLVSAITYMTTAPEWKVPAKIFARELLPKAKKDTAFLENNHLAIYDLKGNFVQPTAANLALVSKTPAIYFARQSAGCDNALGLLVFRFANAYDIYLHDTPEQALFKRKERAFSHGCIRVEQAEKLGSLLLSYDGAKARTGLLHRDITTYTKQNFVLKKPVTIKITYLTCMIKDGELQDFGDPYQLDHSLEMAMYGTDLPLSTSLKK
ncbi:L,D-transpeptidase family protein [Mucilaginibacter sp. SD-g]|uniref:L,D-transpeptidase family protein n=2 Tax=Mucilaginibacter segetis TaxID=2793071 RepID=A0A934UN27_9SPHI|nr:L,D-transpeptidase family protein [Mucilaginibacter segetis]